MGLFFSRQYESYANPPKPDMVDFYPPLSGKSAVDDLAYAETLDNYLQRVEKSPINAYVRRGTNYKPSLYSVNRFVPNEKKGPWPNGQVIWMTDEADGGLPHTRPPRYICLPASHPEKDLATTLTHERIHLSQRQKTNKWIAMLGKAWNFTIYHDALPEKLVSMHRLNPDLIMFPLMKWKEQYVPYAIFRNSKPTSLSDIKVVWFDVQKRVVFESPPKGWVEYFGNIPQGEHPFEMAAYILTSESKSPAKQALTAVLGDLQTD